MSAEIDRRIRKFWARDVPMAFEDQPKTYEEKRRFRYALQDYMHAVFQFDMYGNKQVLEVGSGAGIDSAEFLRYGAQTVSVDFSRFSIRSTKLLLKEANLDGQIALADTKSLPFRDSHFDVVYSFGVIHHIPDVSEALSEIARVLKPGGLFTGMVYNRNSLLYAYSIIYMHGILEGLLAQGATEVEIASKFSERIPGNPYTRAYSNDELESVLKEFFRDISIEAHYNVLDTPKKRKLKFQLENGGESLGWHLVFRALK